MWKFQSQSTVGVDFAGNQRIFKSLILEMLSHGGGHGLHGLLIERMPAFTDELSDRHREDSSTILRAGVDPVAFTQPNGNGGKAQTGAGTVA